MSLSKSSNDGTTPTFIAAQNGHVEVFKILAQHVPDRLSQANNNKVTPAFMAAHNGHVKVLKFLAQHAPDILSKRNIIGLAAVSKKSTQKLLLTV